MKRIVYLLVFGIIISTFQPVAFGAGSPVPGFGGTTTTTSVRVQNYGGVYNNRIYNHGMRPMRSPYKNNNFSSFRSNYEYDRGNVYKIRQTDPIPTSNLSSEKNIPTISCQGLDSYKMIGNQVYKCNTAAATRIKVSNTSANTSTKTVTKSGTKSTSKVVNNLANKKDKISSAPKIVRVRL